MIDQANVRRVPLFGCPLLLRSQASIFIEVRNAGRVLMSQEIAAQRCLGPVSKDHGLQKEPFQALAFITIHSSILSPDYGRAVLPFLPLQPQPGGAVLLF